MPCLCRTRTATIARDRRSSSCSSISGPLQTTTTAQRPRFSLSQPTAASVPRRRLNQARLRQLPPQHPRLLLRRPQHSRFASPSRLRPSHRHHFRRRPHRHREPRRPHPVDRHHRRVRLRRQRFRCLRLPVGGLLRSIGKQQPAHPLQSLRHSTRHHISVAKRTPACNPFCLCFRCRQEITTTLTTTIDTTASFQPGCSQSVCGEGCSLALSRRCFFCWARPSTLCCRGIATSKWPLRATGPSPS
ncbi:hypothetical protein DFJ73DRAFT_831497, partial [Zopfochytrium polystomum]